MASILAVRQEAGVACLALLAGLALPGCATTHSAAAAADDDQAARRAPRALYALESIAQARPSEWRAARASNFTVYYHRDERLARRVGQRAATLWRSISAAWLGRPLGQPAQRCKIYLYANYRQLVILTGGRPKLGSAHVRHSRLMRGRILSCRINLTADDHHLLDGTLPHELTHIVLGRLYGRRVPLWANEGAATLAELVRGRRARRRAVVRHALARGRAYAIADLVRIYIYPASAGQRRVFYAQSFALVDLMVRFGGRPRFLRFLRAARSSSWTAALDKHYGVTSMQQLERHLRSDLSAR